VNLNFNSQAHLFVGKQNKLIDYTYDLLKSVFCKNNSCSNCFICNQIQNNIYEKLLWLVPEKQYNLEQIDLLQSKTAFQLNDNEKFFIILNQADLLTVACSNRLLKLVEEPPKGYYFIFLTERSNSILPTILSRCVVTYLDKDLNDYSFLRENEIANFFVDLKFDFNSFLKIVDKSTINEHELTNLVDNLISYWSVQAKKSILTDNLIEYNRALAYLDILNKTFLRPFMPGSSKIILKNLFISFNAV